MTDADQAPPAIPQAPTARRRGTKGTPPAKTNVLGALGEAPAAPPAARPATPAAAKQEAVPASAPAAAKEAADGAAKAKDKSRKATKTAKERTEPLNFRVTAEFRKAFKRAAAAQDCKKVELLERIFAEWQARNPG